MSQEKEKLLFAFEELKSLEQGGRDYYRDIASDPEVTSKEVKQLMIAISNDEQRHMEIIDSIISIIKNNL